MLTVAVVVFAVAALGGVILASHVLRNKMAPWALSILHALLGASGLVLLALIVSRGVASPLVGWSLGVFVVAALGGFYLASHHLKNRLPPKGVVVLHALLAVTGFCILLAAFLGV
ncbi:MAG: hypothetical protein WD795_20975 [Woeseia sp.]